MATDFLSNTDNNSNPNSKMWGALTEVLAENRSIDYIANVGVYGGKHSKPDQTSQQNALEAMFYEVHTQLYQDTHKLRIGSEARAGVVVEPDKRVKLRNIMHALAEELFDANAAAVQMSHRDLAKIYASYFKQLSELKPFQYGNQLTITTFLSAVSQIPKAKETEGTAIDFRRLSSDNLDAFNQMAASVDEKKLAEIFEQALDSTIDLSIPNERAKADQLVAPHEQQEGHPNKLASSEKADDNPRGLQAWPNHQVEINGVPFLGVEEDGQLYLATVTGGLVPYEEAHQSIIEATKDGLLVDEYPAFKPVKYIDGYQEPEHAGIIDGYEHSKETARLIPMDVNILTGLREESHEKFLGALKDYNSKLEMFALRDDEESQRFLQSVDRRGDERLSKIAGVAVKHIKAMTEQMDRKVDEIVGRGDEIPENGPRPSDDPLLVITMGGSGSGKSSAKDYIRSKVNSAEDIENKRDNFIFTGLDDYRESSQFYKIMQKVGHHADDYSLVEPYANTLRKWVAERALSRGFNILYDGSAIPYKGRYDWLIEKATDKESGHQYNVDVFAVDAFMDVPKDAKANNLTVSTAERVVGRYNDPDENRSLPWAVTLDKHSRAIDAFLDASQDSRLNNVFLMNADGKYGEAYITAHAFNANEGDVQKIESLEPEAYKEILKERGVSDVDLEKIPYLSADNIGYTKSTVDDKDRITMITDMHKMVQMAEKGLQNPYASSLDTLHYRTSNKAGIVPSPVLSGIDRIIGIAEEQLSKVLNYVVPSESYQEALKAEPSESKISI